MVTILALDSSTAACSVAILCGDKLSEDFVVEPQGHARRLLPAVDRLLAETGISLKQVDAVALTVGPGSFTGLRIGLGTVQGIAYGADLPVVPVSTLEVMAATAIRQFSLDPGTVVIPSLDARMGEVYWGHYLVKSRVGPAANGRIPVAPVPVALAPVAMGEDSVDTPDCLTENDFTGGTSVQVVGVGDGWQYATPHPDNVRVHSEFYPRAADLAYLARDRWQTHGLPVFEVSPRYVRNQVNWKKRQRRPAQ